MSDYEPELGQMAFGQPWQAQEPTPSLAGALQAMADTWAVVDYNNSPFSNTGARYDGKTFRAHAYSWDEDEEQEFNFAWRDVRVSWYKHQARGTSVNRKVTDAEAVEILRECLPEILSLAERA